MTHSTRNNCFTHCHDIVQAHQSHSKLRLEINRRCGFFGVIFLGRENRESHCRLLCETGIRHWITLTPPSKNCASCTRINSEVTRAFVANHNILAVGVFMQLDFISAIEMEMTGRLSVPPVSSVGALGLCTKVHMNYFKNIPALCKYDDLPEKIQT